MGAWNTRLYGNDVTCDVRDTYIDLLQEQKSNEEAMHEILKKYDEYMGSDEECFIWYALAESQWKSGRLTEDVKKKALECIAMSDGCVIYDEIKDGAQKWKNTLCKLKVQLESPMPKEKKYRKLKPDIYNPWEIGDVYAYRFSTEYSKENGLYGKYILMQKMADEYEHYKYIFSVIHVFDKLFDEMPKIEDIKGVRILPIDSPYRKEEFKYQFPINLSGVMKFYKKSEYPQNRLTYLGNEKVELLTPTYKVRSEFGWYRLEENWLCDFYKQWQGVNYIIENGVYVVEKV